MFKFYTGDEEQRFESKEQAVDFYNRMTYWSDGSEKDRYSTYAGKISMSDNSEEVSYKFSGNVEQVLVYNFQKDCLQQVMEKIIIDDIHVEWHGEDGMLHFIVELEDGEEKCIRTVMPETKPSFVDAETDEEFENSDYEEWYNEALEDAHEQGYYLSGEED